MKLCRPVVILWVMGVFLAAFNTEASNASYEILYAQEKLSAKVVEAALGEVLLAVAKEAKFEFTLNEAIAIINISVQFDKLPLEEGIKKIIRPFSYSMVFGSSGQLEKVIILKNGLQSAEEPISGAHHSELTQTVAQPGFDSSLGPGGGQDLGLPPSAPVAEVPGEEMAGDHEDQYPTEEQESDMEKAPKHPADDMALPPEAKKQNPSAEGP